MADGERGEETETETEGDVEGVRGMKGMGKGGVTTEK
jgi:hypothetical protein